MRRVTVGDFRLGEVERSAVMDVLDSGRISEGKYVHRFEQAWAEYVGTKYCVATSSGAGALIAGLTALKYAKGLKPGAKVITTPITYIATSSAISVTGFEPVYVDIDPVTFCITPENIREHLGHTNCPEDYALIMPVHLMGFPARMDEINDISAEYNLLTFEDSAQAHGSLYGGKKTGTMSLLSTFSFYIAHNIQAGEMGAVVTNDEEIARLVRQIKAQGRACDCHVCTRSKGYCPLLRPSDEDDFDPKFAHDFIGYNFKTMEFQAALAVTQVEKVEWILARRKENVKYLNGLLEEYSSFLQLPLYSDQVSYLAYPIVIRDAGVITRKALRAALEDRGVETRPLFGCIPTQQRAYAQLCEIYKGRLPNAERVGRNGFYIGCHQYLEKDDLNYIAQVFGDILKDEPLAVKRQ
ncbi:MAG: DegT/DnrJ/EryC1/StrS family aminotransferase [Candidatus Brocadiales bacterium]